MRLLARSHGGPFKKWRQQRARARTLPDPGLQRVHQGASARTDGMHCALQSCVQWLRVTGCIKCRRESRDRVSWWTTGRLRQKSRKPSAMRRGRPRGAPSCSILVSLLLCSSAFPPFFAPCASWPHCPSPFDLSPLLAALQYRKRQRRSNADSLRAIASQAMEEEEGMEDLTQR